MHDVGEVQGLPDVLIKQGVIEDYFCFLFLPFFFQKIVFVSQHWINLGPDGSFHIM